MTDSKGAALTVGDLVRFDTDTRKGIILGTVRGFGDLGIRCDDGDPANPDLLTNGFHCSAWVDSSGVVRVGARS